MPLPYQMALTRMMTNADLLKRENAIVALLTMLGFLNIHPFGADSIDEMPVLQESFNAMHKFIYRQYNTDDEQRFKTTKSDIGP